MSLSIDHEDFIRCPSYDEYVNLIEHSINNPPNSKCEIHHIIPRSMGGNDQNNNLVRLSYRDHFTAHVLLTKCTSGKSKASMCYALNRMSNHGKYKTCIEYENVRDAIVSGISGAGNSFYGKTHTNKSLKLMSAKKIGSLNPMYGRTHSKTTLSKMTKTKSKIVVVDGIRYSSVRHARNAIKVSGKKWKNEYVDAGKVSYVT